MKLFKKILRLIGLIIIISFASISIGIGGAILPQQHHPMKKEDTIEMVEEAGEEDMLK